MIKWEFVISFRKAQWLLECLGPIWLSPSKPDLQSLSLSSCEERTKRALLKKLLLLRLCLALRKVSVFSCLTNVIPKLILTWMSSQPTALLRCIWGRLTTLKKSGMQKVELHAGLATTCDRFYSHNINGQSTKKSSETFTWRIVRPELVTSPRRKHITTAHAA